MPTTTILLTATMLLAGPLQAKKANVPVETARLKHCLVSLIDQVQIPAKQAGVLKLLKVREGDEIKKDGLLAQIGDRDAKVRQQIAEHDYEVARQQATNDVRVRAAVASERVAAAELAQSQEINRKSPGSISKTELMKLDLSREHAELQIDLAKFEFKIADLSSKTQQEQVRLAEHDVLDRQIIAPFDGVVAERFRHQNEWVQQGEPILRLVRLDRLRVEGFMKLADYAPLDVMGCDVTIDVHLSRGRNVQLVGKITYTSPLVEGGEYRVWAEIENIRHKDRQGKQHWLLRPGMEAEMSISIPVEGKIEQSLLR